MNGIPQTTPCANDFSEVIQVTEHRHITYWHDLTTEPYKEKFAFDDGKNTSEDLAHAYVDTLIPWTADSLLACYEQYNLMLMKKYGKGESILIPYSSGIFIHGCTFYGVTANEDLLETLKYNGGKL